MENENRCGWLVWAILVVGLSTGSLACGDDTSMAGGDGDSDAGAEAPAADAGDGADEVPDAGGGANGGDAGADAALVEVTPLAMADGSDGCEPGMLLDTDDQCVEACSLFECGVHSTCEFDAETTEVACICDADRAGEDCACTGSLVDDGNGNCVDPCLDLACSPGTCSVVEGVASCECPEHFVSGGEFCNECEPGYEIVRGEGDPACTLAVPAETNMKLWLDADNDTSVHLHLTTNYVSSWSSLVAAPLAFSTANASLRPHYNDAMAGTAQAAVEFDGVDDALTATLALGGSYSMFIVLKAADRQLDQTVLSASDGGLLTWLRTKNGGTTLQYRHSAGGVSENVTLDGLNLTERSLIEVHRMVPGLQLVVGDKDAAVVQSAAALPSLAFELGRRTDSDSYVFEGPIHEIIVVSPGVSDSDSAAYRDYLRAKWAL